MRKEQVDRFLIQHKLHIIQVYQSDFNNISLHKSFIQKQADGKSNIYPAYVLLSNDDLQQLFICSDMYCEQSGFDTKNELENYIYDEMIDY